MEHEFIWQITSDRITVFGLDLYVQCSHELVLFYGWLGAILYLAGMLWEKSEEMRFSPRLPILPKGA